ncbi:MAG: hypothetical protein CL893_02685 [Dehalococcoidia bacterium]|nr:hypothetical protein [Dehalococcoidia bacterium]|tara:strand:+ start:6745 stop:7245 length:501 start_codon:yes stop_codon:yes gene_type:complete
MKSLLGLYLDPNDAANAMDGLKEGGFEVGTFDVLTGTPYPEGAFGEHVPQHRLFRFPAFGAIIGFSLSLFLTTATQLAYPLITGGKPILSIFAMLIIMYEMTMLSAVIFSVIGIIFESRLPNIAPGVYDPRITEGYIGVVISVEDSDLNKAKKILEKSGSEEIKEA